MKVICIDDNWMKGQTPTTKGPKFGDIETVVNCRTIFRQSYYELVGWKLYYEVENFIPLSKIDEMEIIEQRESVKVIM